MIIPSIDLMGGNAVQLVGGKELEIDAGDPRPLADKFGRVGGSLKKIRSHLFELIPRYGKGERFAFMPTGKGSFRFFGKGHLREIAIVSHDLDGHRRSTRIRTMLFFKFISEEVQQSIVPINAA